ncbi:MAG TPA: hypothetical protein VNY53_11495, partial [Bradyrhizobium sp.]|nr:hypothetical protein [Bradyrhizobium sp.]
GDAENYPALALHQFRVFHHVTIPVLGSSFGGTPAVTAGTGLSAKVNSHTRSVTGGIAITVWGLAVCIAL